MANISLPNGYKLREYTISKRISKGGFSYVYIGYTQDKIPVAIKEYFPGKLQLRERGDKVSFINKDQKHTFDIGLKAFKAEMEIVSKLKHKNIIEITNYLELNGTAYIIMPFESGIELNKYVYQRKSLDEKDIINIMIGVFSAIDLLHKNDIVHLDIKPPNIMLKPNKEPMILDFGTARNFVTNVKKSTPMFTIGYAAPEQHSPNFHELLGPWTDYYALGATLYSLIMGKNAKSAVHLVKSGKRIEIVAQKYGLYNKELLEIVEDLTNPRIDERKKLSLEDIIQRMSALRPMNPKKIIVDNLSFK